MDRVAIVLSAVVLSLTSSAVDDHGVGLFEGDRVHIGLDPAQPMTYFEKAEEIGYSAQSDLELQLARELTLMSWLLQPTAQERGAFERSIALLLADLSTDPNERQRYLSLSQAQSAEAEAVQTGSTRAALKAISSIRKGDWSALRTALRGFAPRASLFGVGVRQSDIAVFERLLIRYRDTHTQPAAIRNQRGNAQGTTHRANPENNGNPAPELTDAEGDTLLRIEAALLNVEASDWAVSLLLTRDAPAQIYSLGSTARSYELDPSRPLPIPSAQGWSWAAVGAGSDGVSQ